MLLPQRMRPVVLQPPLKKVIPTPLSFRGLPALIQELGNALRKAFGAHVHATTHRLSGLTVRPSCSQYLLLNQKHTQDRSLFFHRYDQVRLPPQLRIVSFPRHYRESETIR